MEPVTTLGFGAITAYLAKDGIAKLLGPTAAYLGEGLRDLTHRRGESIGRIFSNASAKLGDQLDAPGQVPPRVLRTVMNEGSYCEDSVAVEYLGGVLASSRTKHGRDDRGVRMARLVDNLSTYQIRTHYLLYSSIATLFSGSQSRFATDQDREKMRIFLPSSRLCHLDGILSGGMGQPTDPPAPHLARSFCGRPDRGTVAVRQPAVAQSHILGAAERRDHLSSVVARRRAVPLGIRPWTRST